MTHCCQPSLSLRVPCAVCSAAMRESQWDHLRRPHEITSHDHTAILTLVLWAHMVYTHTHTPTLLSDLESFLASGGDCLQHLVRTDVSFEVARIPELTK